jgi:hypothetical protein
VSDLLVTIITIVGSLLASFVGGVGGSYLGS